MGFVISKVLLWLVLPPAGLLILMAVGYAIIKASRPVGKILMVSSFLLLYLLSIRICSDALMKPLEASSPPLRAPAVKADAVVVLGGGVKDLSWVKSAQEPSAVSLERLLTGIRLHRALHIPLVLAGGNGDPEKQALPDAEAMAHTAKSLGVPRKDIILENKSRNTIESARALKHILKGKRIVLVTSASHMRRASAMFKAGGFEVVPAPTGYVSEQRTFSLYSLIPRADYLYVSSTALYEYLSFLWYKSKGDI